MSPGLLLIFCFIVGTGMALFGPAWQASTIHYRGDGEFMVSGREVNFRKMFRPENL